jgi:hypothetical protein
MDRVLLYIQIILMKKDFGKGEKESSKKNQKKKKIKRKNLTNQFCPNEYTLIILN